MYCPWQARWITGVTTSGFVLPQLKQPTNEVKHAQVNMLNLSCSLVRSLFPLHCIFKRVICLRLQLQSRTRRSTSFGGIHKLQTSSNFSYKIWIILDIICIYISNWMKATSCVGYAVDRSSWNSALRLTCSWNTSQHSQRTKTSSKWTNIKTY